jgi:hypothetical protein
MQHLQHHPPLSAIAFHPQGLQTAPGMQASCVQQILRQAAAVPAVALVATAPAVTGTKPASTAAAPLQTAAGGAAGTQLDWGGVSKQQQAEILAAAADFAKTQQYKPGSGTLAVPLLLQGAVVQASVLNSMPRDVFQLLAWPTAAAAAAGPPAAVCFQKQHWMTTHNHCNAGAGSRAWSPQHDGHVQHTVLPAHSTTPVAASVKVSYEFTSGPKGWTVYHLPGGLGLAKAKGIATVTVSNMRQPPADSSRGSKRSSGAQSGKCTICTVHVEFERIMPLRQQGLGPQAGQQQQQELGGFCRPYPQGGGWLLGCVALNTFTGTVLRQDPPGEPLPVIITDGPPVPTPIDQ